MDGGKNKERHTKMKAAKSKKKVAKAKTVAKGKVTKASEPVAAAPKIAVNIKRDRMDVGVDNLTPAPWNPRGEISPESVADLVASIATVGVIEPVVVMPTSASLPKVSGPVYIIIAGHRRVKAAKLAGLATIPCDVLLGIDAATAKRMTFIENLQRRDADPLLESNLVAELVADGMTTDEIAAEIGRDRKWVLRRKNLANLSPSWRKRVADGEKIAIDCLEHIAAYPAELQESLKKERCNTYDRVDGVLRWANIRYAFTHASRDLRDVRFDCADCRACANNTGCTPDLFDWDNGKPTALGLCTNAKCFERKSAAYIEDVVAAAKAKGTAIIKRAPGYYIDTAARKTKKCCVLYVYREPYKDHDTIAWGEPPPKATASTGSGSDGDSPVSAADLAAERKAKREHNSAIRHLAEICAADGNLANWLKSLAAGRASAPFVIQHLFSGIDSYRLVGTSTEIEKAAFVYFLMTPNWPSTIPDGYWKSVAEAVIHNLNPSRNAYTADVNAGRICALFAAELRATDLTDEEADRILPPQGREDLAQLSVKWDDPDAAPAAAPAADFEDIPF